MPLALITGANGFCGRHLARRLAAEGGCSIVGLDVHPEPQCDAVLDDYLPVDITDAQTVAAAVRHSRPDFVFHLAGRLRGTADQLYQVNFLGGIRLLEAIHESRPDARILLVGSAAEYGRAPTSALPLTEEYPCRPADAYGLSKYALCLAARDYVQNYGMKVAMVRPFNLVGAGMSAELVIGAALNRMKEALARGGEPSIAIGNLDTQRDFVPIEDAIGAYVRILRGEYWGEVFNICSGQPRSIRSVIEQLLSYCEGRIRLHVDSGLLRPADAPVIYGSWTKANAVFGFEPMTDFDAALHAAWDHVLNSLA